MDTHIQGIVVPVYELYGFLFPAVVDHFHQPSEYPYPMVDVDHIITDFEPGQVIDGDLLAFLDRPFEVYPVNTLEKLVVCIIAYLVAVIGETLV